jgi:hypothetical protein
MTPAVMQHLHFCSLRANGLTFHRLSAVPIEKAELFRSTFVTGLLDPLDRFQSPSFRANPGWADQLHDLLGLA